MSLTDDLYRDIILEHFKNPRNHGRLERPALVSQGANPFCGDELELTLDLEGEMLRDIRVDAKGCSISQSSASMMSEAVKGKSLQEAEGLIRRFKAAMLENGSFDFGPEMEDLQALEGVKKYPVRIKCAILSWNTLQEGIHAHRKGRKEASHVEGEEGPHPDLASLVETAAEGSGAAPAVASGSSAAAPVGAPAPGGEPPDLQVREALRTVIDPELNMNVVDLGLIYGIDLNAASVKVTYTLTSPGCPLGPVIKGQMQSALTKLPWIKEVQTHLVWQPPWDPRTMASDEVKTELGIW